jgi:hypothetical protein
MSCNWQTIRRSKIKHILFACVLCCARSGGVQDNIGSISTTFFHLRSGSIFPRSGSATISGSFDYIRGGSSLNEPQSSEPDEQLDMNDEESSARSVSENAAKVFVPHASEQLAWTFPLAQIRAHATLLGRMHGLQHSARLNENLFDYTFP